MTKAISLTNTGSQALDPLVVSAAESAYKRALATRTLSGLDHKVAHEAIGTHEDDSAFTAADAVVLLAGLADETAPDSVDEGDVGAVRMTLDRHLYTKEKRSATGTTSSVNDSASSVTVLAANAARLGATVYNDSTVALYLKLGATASATDFTVKIAADGYYEVPSGYTGIIDGIWASDASGAARVTELT